MARFPNDENGQRLRDYQKLGQDLSKPCLIGYSYLFEDEHSARSMASATESLGGHVDVFDTEDFDDKGIEMAAWEVHCTFLMSPTHEAISARETELAELAKRFGGQDDGWAIVHERLFDE